MKVSQLVSWPLEYAGAAFDPKKAHFVTQPHDAVVKNAKLVTEGVEFSLEGGSSITMECEAGLAKAVLSLTAPGMKMKHIGDLDVPSR